jgi:hypothetical protein
MRIGTTPERNSGITLTAVLAQFALQSGCRIRAERLASRRQEASWRLRLAAQPLAQHRSLANRTGLGCVSYGPKHAGNPFGIHFEPGLTRIASLRTGSLTFWTEPIYFCRSTWPVVEPFFPTGAVYKDVG